jgi:uncharacterized membrane protein
METREQESRTIQSVNPLEPVREEDKIHLVLAYLGLLALIPLITVKDSPFINWHAKNGLVLGLGGGIVLSIVSAILTPVFCIGPLIGLAGGIALIVVDVMAMLKALNGQRWRIPVISDLADKL